jgi:hypothetical protein
LINRCSMFSFSSQKAHFLSPLQFLLTKLSFVRISFLFRNHMKILIFKGTLIFHRYFKHNILKTSRKNWMYIYMVEVCI